MLSPDEVLQNRYRIGRQLGKGGMGAVYEARDQRLNTTVALKECLLDDPALRQQFEREAQMLARLRHATLPREVIYTRWLPRFITWPHDVCRRMP